MTYENEFQPDHLGLSLPDDSETEEVVQLGGMF